MTAEKSTPALDPSGANLHAEVARLRAHGPATLVELPGGVSAWLVTDHAVLRRLLSGPEVTKDPREWPELAAGQIPQDWVMSPWVRVRNMLVSTGTEHQRLRRAVAPAFTANRTRALRPRITAITATLLDELADTPEGETADLRAGFARPLPIRVISELMGVPDALAVPLCRAADGILDTSATPEQVQADFAAMMGVVGEVIETKRQRPGDDLTSLLIADPDGEGPHLDDRELLDTLALIITAGHETTVNLLDHAMTALLTDPALLADVIAGRTLWVDLIEEALRHQPPIAHMPLRYAREDIDLGGGVQIAKGEAIIASFAGANRDPAVYGADAHEFDPTRDNQNHLAFGHGIHHCLGAPLARLEARVALPALFERFPDMRLAATASELGHLPSLVMNGHVRLPVLLRPTGTP